MRKITAETQRHKDFRINLKILCILLFTGLLVSGCSERENGVLLEKITLAEDGQSFKSTIKLDLFDTAGKSTETGSEAEAQAVQMGF